MVGVTPDVNVGQNLLVQLGHSAQELLLYFLLRDINSVEECDRIAALGILMVSETRPAPKSAAAGSLSKKFKMEVCLIGDEKWTSAKRNWRQAYGELSMMYEVRLPE